MENFNVSLRKNGVRMEATDGSWAVEFGEMTPQAGLMKYLIAQDKQDEVEDMCVLMYTTGLIMTNAQMLTEYGKLLDKVINQQELKEEDDGNK